MLTYTQTTNRAYDMVGSPQDNGVTMNNIIQDTNVCTSLFKNAVRNYWTRQQVTANLQNPTGVGGFTCIQNVYTAPSAGTIAYSLALCSNSSTNSVTWTGGTSYPAYILVECC